MPDEFGTFLARSLAPPDRDPDRAFVARIEAQIMFSERLRAEQRAALRALGGQIVALCAVAAGLFWLAQSAAVVEFTAQSPALTLAAVLTSFGLLVALFSTRDRGEMLNG